jgi:hypothetical protein
VVGCWPARQTIGLPVSPATQRPVTAFVSPHPAVTDRTPGRPVLRAYGVGGVRARLLVPHVDHLDVVLAEVRQDGPDVAAVHREEVADLLLGEDAPDEARRRRRGSRRPGAAGFASESPIFRVPSMALLPGRGRRVAARLATAVHLRDQSLETLDRGLRPCLRPLRSGPPRLPPGSPPPRRDARQDRRRRRNPATAARWRGRTRASADARTRAARSQVEADSPRE